MCSSLYYCLGSRSNDIMSFVVSLSSYVLYSYMRSYSQSHTLLCICDAGIFISSSGDLFTEDRLY
mgnify:CR=1 FL=1